MTAKAKFVSSRRGGGSIARSPTKGSGDDLQPPPSRKKFEGAWDEISYLYKKVLYWLYGRGDRRRALEFRDRFEALLCETASSHEAIFGEECWSILREMDEDFRGAIRHREREIELIIKLWEVSERSPAKDFVLTRYGPADLCDRLDLLATLYHHAGDLDRAIVLLVESKRLCESTGSPFDGEDLLQEYLDEREPRLARFLREERCSEGEPIHRSFV